MRDTDRMWERWGQYDPYYGVLADDRFNAANIDANRGEFFVTGDAYVAHLLARYAQHFGELQRGRALDHGCGVGRLTLALARQFESVVGLDVSPTMLREAAANAEAQGLSNVTFALADDGLREASGTFDFVNSYIVLQHVPVSRGLRIFDALIDKTAPGGGFQIHVSIRTDAWRSRALWWASINVPGVKILQNILAGRPWNVPAMQMNDYPVGRLLTHLTDRGIADVLVGLERHDKFVTCSLLGRKPA